MKREKKNLEKKKKQQRHTENQASKQARELNFVNREKKKYKYKR